MEPKKESKGKIFIGQEEEVEVEESYEEELDEYDDFYEDFGYTRYEVEEWEEPPEKAEQEDWEREAKKKVHIEIEEPSVERRKTIQDLDAYAASGPSTSDILKLSKTDVAVEPPEKIRYSISMGMPGIARINLSPLTQKIIGCVIGENVTTEYPWVYVRKEIIEDNMDLHDESSEFLPMKNEIETFPDTKILIGYAPLSTGEGQFYVCLTEEGRDAVVRHIQHQRMDHESRVRNAVYKSTGHWNDLGSGTEMDETFVKSGRPLFEIEMTSTTDALNAPMNLEDRKADDQRDGYVELLPYRQTFESVSRKLVTRMAQVTVAVRENEAQTTPSVPANNWFQYLYKWEPENVSIYTEERLESLKNFLERYTERICDEVLLNATWDLHTNDYKNLVQNERDTQPPVAVSYKEFQSYYDVKLVGEKVINDLCWHPFWTGIPIAAYVRHAKSDYLIGERFYDMGYRTEESNDHALIWSFNDCLSPKLVLESSREVTSVTVCPLDGNVIVGGCANGQIVIWHIPGMIEKVETIPVRTSAQVRYRIIMRSLMGWMLDPINTSIVKPVAMSSLRDSQKGAITQIVWLPAHYKISKTGRIVALKEDVKVNDLNWQFVTASEDGTIAFWDLKSRPTERDTVRSQKRRRKLPRPDALTQSLSPLKALDRIFKPDYILVLQYPDESRRPVITALSMYNPKFRKEQIEPFPMENQDITVRRYYQPVVEMPDYSMNPGILIGTVEGDFGRITWEGFEFTAGMTVNREICQWQWIKKIHDGPVTHSVRSKYYSNVVATVGGKIFAVWREDFEEPIIWKRSSVRYTACSWGTFRPTVLILARADGTAEIWDFVVDSHRPSFEQSVSGHAITGIYTHELYLNPQCVGFCDFHGILRIFLAPGVFMTYDATDVEWMRKFVCRQVDRIREFKTWQKTWRETNPESIEMRKRLAEIETERKRIETEERIKAEMATMSLEASKKSLLRRKPWQFLEQARSRWQSTELGRMQQVILEKKGLKGEVLERQREPVLKLQQEKRRKKRKIREILQLQDKIFEETLAFLFPEQHQERKRVTLPPLATSTPGKGVQERKLTITDFLTGDLAFLKEKVVDPEYEIIYNFLEVQAEALANIKTHSFEHAFDWRKILSEGRSRRRSMDVELQRSNRQRKRHEERDISKLSLEWKNGRNRDVTVGM